MWRLDAVFVLAQSKSCERELGNVAGWQETALEDKMEKSRGSQKLAFATRMI